MKLSFSTGSSFSDIISEIQKATPAVLAIWDDKLLIYQKTEDVPTDIIYEGSVRSINNGILYIGNKDGKQYRFFDRRCLDIMRVKENTDMIGLTFIVGEQNNTSPSSKFVCTIDP